MRGQSGFFDVDERLKDLSAKGDALERLNAVVDFELFRPALSRAVPRSDGSMRATVFGVAAVVIPEAEFRRLVRAATDARREARRRRAPSPSKLDDQDPEVAAFVPERLLAGATISVAEMAARSTFGRDRAPSWNAIQRFRLKVIQEKAPAEPAASIG